MESEKVKEFVKKRYGEIAQTEQSCCCSSSCCGPSMKDVALQIGYSERDIENIPDDSVLGLGLKINPKNQNALALICYAAKEKETEGTLIPAY